MVKNTKTIPLPWRTEFSRTCVLCGSTHLEINEAEGKVTCYREHWCTFKELQDYQTSKLSEAKLLDRMRDRALKERRAGND